MFVALHSDFSSLKSGLLHLTGQPNFPNRVEKSQRWKIFRNHILRGYLS